MENFYQQFSEVDQFNNASDEDKLVFGNLYADELIASDERFSQNPELGEYLRKQITDNISANLTPIEEPTEDRGLLDTQYTPEEISTRFDTVFGKGIMGDVRQTVGDIGADINAISSRGFGENLGALGENTANVLLHTLGIPGRLLAGMAQLPHAAASLAMEKMGMGDSVANQWVKAQYAGLERDKQLMTVYNNVLTQYEPDVLLAAGMGAGFGAGIHAYKHRALNGAAKIAASPGFSAADVAIVNGWTTAVGEAIVVAPALRVSEHYISESGYTEDTKNVLRATLPMLLGVVSGMTLELRIDKMLRNPLVVDEIVSGVAKGLGPVELGDNVSRIVKAPTILEDLAKKTNGRVPRESLPAFGESFNIAGGFRRGAEFPPIRVGFEEAPSVTPRQIEQIMGQKEATAQTVEQAVDHFVRQPMNTAEGLKKTFDSITLKKRLKESKITAQETKGIKVSDIDKAEITEINKKLFKLQSMVVRETNRATVAQDALAKLDDPAVNEMLHSIIEHRTPELGPMTKRRMLYSDAMDADETQGIIADLLAKGAKVDDELVAKGNFVKDIGDAYDARLISIDDARRAVALSEDSSKGWLFNGERSEIMRSLDDIGINGQDNRSLGEWATAHLHNQKGYVDPAFIRNTMIHSVPLMTGLETKDGELTWNTNKYLKYGAKWHALGFGALAYRRLGTGKVVRGIGSKVGKKFWEMTEAPVMRGLGKPLRKFRPTEGLDPRVHEFKKQFKTKKQQLRRQLDEFAIDLKKNFNDDELEMMSDFIEKENNWRSVPQVVQEQAAEVQSLLKGIREQLIASGVDDEVVGRLGDDYLHRVYLPQLLKKPTYKNVKAKLKAIQAHYLKRRGKNAVMNKKFEQMELTDVDFAKGDKVYYGLSDDGKKIWVHEAQIDKLNDLKTQGPVREWEIVETGKRIVANTDYSKAEREAMGESRDVALRLAVFFRETSHDIALGTMFKSIDVDPRWTMKNVDKLSKKAFSKSARDAEFVKMPDKYTPSGVAKYGKLNGQWVHPDVAEVLNNMTKKRYDAQWKETIAMMNSRALTTWKIAKTAYNPGTHAINVITNLHIATMDGRNPIRLVSDGVQSLATKDKFFREAVDAGMSDTGVLAGEWNLKQFKAATDKLRPSPENMPLVLRAMAKSYGAVKKGLKAPMVMYQWEDEVFKLGVFKAERMKGANPEEAMAAANRLFFDYSDVPSGVEVLRDTGIVPFISWSYKIMPVIARTAVDHPERILGMIMAYKVASDYAFETQFGDRADAQMKLEREVRPDFQKQKFFGVGPDTQLRLMNDPDTGQARTLDVGRYIPGADLFSDYGNSFPFGMHPLVSLIYGMSSGKHAAFGTKILPFAEPQNAFQEAENFDAKMKHLTNTILPNIPFIPYTYSSDRVGNALVSTGDINENSGFLWDYAQRRGWNGKDYFGHDLDLSDEILSSVGVKINRMDVEQAAQKKIARTARKFGTASRELSKSYTERKSTPSRRLRALQGYGEETSKHAQELEDLTTLLQSTRQ